MVTKALELAQWGSDLIVDFTANTVTYSRGFTTFNTNVTDKLLSPGGSAFVGTVATGSTNGAIIERGSNANGAYTKFADGTMVCWHTVTTSTSAVVTWTYPATFTSGSPKVYATLESATAARFATFSLPQTTSVDISGWNDAGGRAANNVNVLAVGRWY